MSAMTTMSIPVLTQSGGAAVIASPRPEWRQQVQYRLNGRCRPVEHAQGGADALAKLEKGQCRVLFLDRRLNDLDAEELMDIIGRRFPTVQVVLLDSDAGNEGQRQEEGEQEGEREREREDDSPAASEAVRQPSLPRRAAENGTARVAPLPGMIGGSEPMQRVYRMVRLVAARNTTLLIAGQTGTGKELVARAVHALSPRSARPLIVVNCAAIPETLLESELFGFARGAFTGAVQAQLGRIAAAQGGTLFLDEVSELPLSMQAKLLRFLEQKEIQRLGSSEVMRVDVRVVAASNVDLLARAARGEFRQDLYYRLSAFPIVLPALAERRGDIVPLAEHFLACMAAAMGMPQPRLSGAAQRMLEAHSWNGNVRELQHVMERASILVENGDVVETEHLYFPGRHCLDRPGLDTAAAP